MFNVLYSFANMWESFVLLFSEMTPIVAILFVLGILLMIAETFIPGIGFFGFSGLACFVIAVIIRMVQGGNVYMFLYMLLFALILVGGCFLLVANSIRKGKLQKTSMFNVGSALPEGITEGTKDYSYLIGKEGVTTTLLRPLGIALIEGERVDVTAKSGVIDADTPIKVVRVEGQRIEVEAVI